MDVNQTLEFKVSSAKIFGLVLVGLVMTSVSFAVAWRLFPEVEPGSYIEFNGWAGTIIFGAGTLYFLWRIIGPNKLFLKLSPSGFHHSSVTSAAVPWTEVEGISNWGYRGTKMLIVKVPESTWQSASISRTARWSRGANRSLGADGLAISPSGLAISFDELAILFQTYARAHGGKVD